MQIFLKLHILCSSHGKQDSCARGFTLIELLISIGIIGILTSMVLIRYGSFDSTVLLKSTAYEIGLNLREAQVRSVSAARGSGGFDKPFGISFDMNNEKQYVLFSDQNYPTNIPPVYEDELNEVVQTVIIDRTMRLDSLCIIQFGNSEDCTVAKIDISYKRPEYKSLIYAEDSSGDPIVGVTDAKIKLSSPNAVTKFVVSVSQLGQINVEAEK